jgi:hypothetical protein
VLDTVAQVTTNRGAIETGYRFAIQAVVQALKERNGLMQVMDIRAEQAFHVTLL